MHSKPSTGGISASNRTRLAVLHRSLTGPFTVEDAARALAIKPQTARRFLAYLASRGWLARIRRNLYTTVPLDAGVPSDWREDPWVVAERTFAPCYIGGWSACEHWNLTEQIFQDTLVMTARPGRHRHRVIQGATFRIRAVNEDKLFGLETVWRGQIPVKVSDASRTLADLLVDPALGGGIRQVADIVGEYFRGELRRDDLLLDYVGRLGRGVTYKRLGYLIEALGIEAPILLDACLQKRTSGFIALDPSLPASGPLVSRWNLQLNARLSPEQLVS